MWTLLQAGNPNILGIRKAGTLNERSNYWLTQVSKTTFIQALTLTLSEIGGKPGMPEIGFRPCNDVTMKWYQDIRIRAAQGREPDPTSKLHEDDVYLFTVSGIPRWGLVQWLFAMFVEKL